MGFFCFRGERYRALNDPSSIRPFPTVLNTQQLSPESLVRIDQVSKKLSPALHRAYRSLHHRAVRRGQCRLMSHAERAVLKIARQPVTFLQSYIYRFRPKECPMRTHRFGRKIKLPATIAIKHQIRMLMAQDEVKKAEAKLIDQSARRTARDDRLPLSDMAH